MTNFGLITALAMGLGSRGLDGVYDRPRRVKLSPSKDTSKQRKNRRRRNKIAKASRSFNRKRA